MTSTSPHRIDPPSPSVPRIGARSALVEAVVTGDLSEQASGPDQSHPEPASDAGGKPATREGRLTDQLLSLHAADLIERLQQWSEDLETREAKLANRAFLQDQRERQFRTQQQAIETEIEEKKRSLERQQQQLQAQARRLAFTD